MCKFVFKTKKFSKRFQINSLYEECVDLFQAIKQNYFDLLVEMDDAVQFLLDKNLKSLKKKIIELESCESQRKQLREIIDKYNSITESERARH